MSHTQSKSTSISTVPHSVEQLVSRYTKPADGCIESNSDDAPNIRTSSQATTVLPRSEDESDPVDQDSDSANSDALIKSVKTTDEKPSHSYIALIAMAILASQEKKLALSDIYNYIVHRYPFFQSQDKSWRNSIRHNLSVNECFVKSGRNMLGKGHYWAIHPANYENFANGDFRRRRVRRRITQCFVDAHPIYEDRVRNLEFNPLVVRALYDWDIRRIRHESVPYVAGNDCSRTRSYQHRPTNRSSGMSPYNTPTVRRSSTTIDGRSLESLKSQKSLSFSIENILCSKPRNNQSGIVSHPVVNGVMHQVSEICHVCRYSDDKILSRAWNSCNPSYKPSIRGPNFWCGKVKDFNSEIVF